MSSNDPQLPKATHPRDFQAGLSAVRPLGDIPDFASIFSRAWSIATEDENITMYGFKRFKTSHLLNLRYLEHDLGKLDREIYQAGLSLNTAPSRTGRLWLGHAKKDENIKGIPDVACEENILRFRRLISEYGK